MAARMKHLESRNVQHSPGEEPPVCELCLRESARFTDHHLVPRSRGGKHGPKARLCPTCHRQLHAMFSEKTLANELNSIDDDSGTQLEVDFDREVPLVVMGHNILEYSGFARLCTEYAVASIRQQRVIPENEFQLLLARN